MHVMFGKVTNPVYNIICTVVKIMVCRRNTDDFDGEYT